MSDDQSATLARVTLEVLERYAFMLADPKTGGGGEADFPTPVWAAGLRYAGPLCGSLGMIAPPSLARSIAANLYGAETGEVTEEQAQDALKELLNIICGDYLHETSGDEPIFDLTAPGLESLAIEEALQRAAGRPRAVLDVEGMPMMVYTGG